MDERGCEMSFYGAVTVSDRGQIVIPVEARRDLGIAVGEKLLVLRGPGGGLLLVRASLIGEMVGRWTMVIRRLEAEGLAETSTEGTKS